MKVEKTKINDCLIIHPSVHGDDRGLFFESYQRERYYQAGINGEFVQDNFSRSSYGVLRGLHFQKTKPQGKLVHVTKGRVFDVAVDLREGSPTYGEHEAVVLDAENRIQFYVPPGFAHGFCVLSDTAEFVYKCTDYYDPEDEGGIIWNDAQLGINWPIETPLLSEKDSLLPRLK